MSLFEKFFGRKDGFVPGTHTYSILGKEGEEVSRGAVFIERAKFFVDPEAEKLLLKWGVSVGGDGKIIAPVTVKNHKIEAIKKSNPSIAKKMGLKFDQEYKKLDKIDKYTVEPPHSLTEVKVELRSTNKVVIIYKYKNVDSVDSKEECEIFPDPEFPNEAVCVRRLAKDE